MLYADSVKNSNLIERIIVRRAKGILIHSDALVALLLTFLLSITVVS